jgi:hypothetical protein
MKKVSGNNASKPAKTGPKQTQDELTESQQLRRRVRAIVHEIEETITILQENLRKARLIPHSQPVVMERFAREANAVKATNNSKHRKRNHSAETAEDIAPLRPVRPKEYYRSSQKTNRDQ